MRRAAWSGSRRPGFSGDRGPGSAPGWDDAADAATPPRPRSFCPISARRAGASGSEDERDLLARIRIRRRREEPRLGGVSRLGHARIGAGAMEEEVIEEKGVAGLEGRGARRRHRRGPEPPRRLKTSRSRLRVCPARRCDRAASRRDPSPARRGRKPSEQPRRSGSGCSCRGRRRPGATTRSHPGGYASQGSLVQRDRRTPTPR